jgi:hypothetical protein
MKVNRSTKKDSPQEELVIANTPVEGFKDQEGNEVSAKDFIIQILNSPGEKGLTTPEMRSRVFVINKLKESEKLSLSKDEFSFVLGVLQSVKFPQILMGVLKLEEEIASKINPQPAATA